MILSYPAQHGFELSSPHSFWLLGYPAQHGFELSSPIGFQFFGLSSPHARVSKELYIYLFIYLY